MACLVLGSVASKQQLVGISNGRSEGIYFRSIYSNFLLHAVCCKGPGTAEKSATSLISLMSFNCLFPWTFARFLWHRHMAGYEFSLLTIVAKSLVVHSLRLYNPFTMIMWFLACYVLIAWIIFALQILNKQYIEEAEKVKTVPDLRPGDIIELRMVKIPRL